MKMRIFEFFFVLPHADASNRLMSSRLMALLRAYMRALLRVPLSALRAP